MVRKTLSKDELDQASKILESTRKNLSWIADNFSILRKDYPNEYIAVCDGQVLVSGTSKGLVRERAGEKVTDPDRITVKKIEPERRVLIL